VRNSGRALVRAVGRPVRRGRTSGEFFEVSSLKVQNLPYDFDGTRCGNFLSTLSRRRRSLRSTERRRKAFGLSIPKLIGGTPSSVPRRSLRRRLGRWNSCGRTLSRGRTPSCLQPNRRYPRISGRRSEHSGNDHRIIGAKIEQTGQSGQSTVNASTLGCPMARCSNTCGTSSDARQGHERSPQSKSRPPRHPSRARHRGCHSGGHERLHVGAKDAPKERGFPDKGKARYQADSPEVQTFYRVNRYPAK
jgi:hypothetical protein